MTTPLEKTLKRELRLKGQTYIVTISPEGLKLTLKGRRKGVGLAWEALISGDAALAAALSASLGQLQPREEAAGAKAPAQKPRAPRPGPGK